MKIGEVIKIARKMRGVSLRQAAKEIGISNSYLCQIEKESCNNLSFKLMLKIFKYYNISHKMLNDIEYD